MGQQTEQATTERMGVDPLAVLERGIAFESACQYRDDLIEARAAVAKLVEAHRQALNFIGGLPGNYNPPDNGYKRWQDALSPFSEAGR